MCKIVSPVSCVFFCFFLYLENTFSKDGKQQPAKSCWWHFRGLRPAVLDSLWVNQKVMYYISYVTYVEGSVLGYLSAH